jgi:DNA-directed RNA polymerase III subunit RPC1
LESIRFSILKAPKLKMNAANVNVSYPNEIKVTVPDSSSGNAFLTLQHLKRGLPKVIIKGYPAIGRAVINDNEGEKRLNLLVEGYGLKDVLGIEGIDGTKTKSNHVLESLATLGIEAAR